MGRDQPCGRRRAAAHQPAQAGGARDAVADHSAPPHGHRSQPGDHRGGNRCLPPCACQLIASISIPGVVLRGISLRTRVTEQEKREPPPPPSLYHACIAYKGGIPLSLSVSPSCSEARSLTPVCICRDCAQMQAACDKALDGGLRGMHFLSDGLWFVQMASVDFADGHSRTYERRFPFH
eukprot:COSAG05_NODE_624_length_8276_cov_4.903265_8_plen_179_part_00